jgi:hypothetical protein
MSKKVSTKIFSAIMVMALAVSANVSGYMGGFDDDRAHVNLNVGSKMISIDDKYVDDIKDLKNQTQFGIDFDYKLDVLPFNIAVGYFASSSEKGNYTLSLSDLRLGVRKYQDFDAFSIYYGGGLSSVTAKIEYDSPGITDAETASTLGFYGEVGGLYNVTEAIYVGANVTYTSATVEFEKFFVKKEKMDVSAAQIGLVVGYAF